MTAALAYFWLALDLIVGAVILFAVVAIVWWASVRTVRAVRSPERKPLD